MTETVALDAVRHRFAEILDEALPDADPIAFADLVDECAEGLLARFSELTGQPSESGATLPA